MQHARRNQPAGAALQTIRLRQVEDPVVPLVPILQALAQLSLGGARLQTHKRITKIVVDVVQLRREVIALGLPFLADELGVFELLVHVMGDRPHVVEEFGIDGPTFVLRVHRLADELVAGFADGVAQLEPLPFVQHVAQAFVDRAILVRRLGRAGEPPLVDAAAIGPEGVVIFRMQFDPMPRMQKAPRHPRRREPQQPFARIERGVQNLGDVIFGDDRRRRDAHGTFNGPA